MFCWPKGVLLCSAFTAVGIRSRRIDRPGTLILGLWLALAAPGGAPAAPLVPPGTQKILVFIAPDTEIIDF